MQATLAAATILALAACAPAVPGTARAALVPAAMAPAPRLAQIDILDRDTGEHLPVYWHDGQRWVAGAPGHRYAIALRNLSGGRILTVVSIDGVNAVSGETAGWDQRGYVFAPWQSYEILGWRKSTSAVADFLFTAVADSYAARTGRAADVGVIGIAVFPEARPVAPEPQVSLLQRSDTTLRALADVPSAPAAAPAPATAGSTADATAKAAAREFQDDSRTRQRLGTGHGQSESSPVSLVDFTRERDRPDEVITIRYDRYDRLLAMGVIPVPATRPPVPNAFPGSADAGFVPDPPHRN